MEKYRNSVKLVRAEVNGSNTREPTTRNSTNTSMESWPPNSRYVPHSTIIVSPARTNVMLNRTNGPNRAS